MLTAAIESFHNHILGKYKTEKDMKVLRENQERADQRARESEQQRIAAENQAAAERQRLQQQIDDANRRRGHRGGVLRKVGKRLRF